MRIFSCISENPEDIHPYATFVLPEVSCGNENDQLQDYAAPKDARTIINAKSRNKEDNAGDLQGVNPQNMGTISNFDMLILHENSTLPLSDACSKSVSKKIMFGPCKNLLKYSLLAPSALVFSCFPLLAV